LGLLDDVHGQGGWRLVVWFCDLFFVTEFLTHNGKLMPACKHLVRQQLASSA
jgi:hypothetical protein